MIGYAFMGKAHSNAWRNVRQFLRRPGLRAESARGPGRRPGGRGRGKYGWAESATDWRTVMDRDDIHIVDICAPGWMHAEIAIAALEAGKHVLVEKPLANTLAEAEAMTAAAADGPGEGRAVDDRLQLPPRPGPRPGQGTHRRRPARDRPARPRRLPAGLARRRRLPHDLAAPQGNRRLRRARRHRLARDRPGPVSCWATTSPRSPAGSTPSWTAAPALARRRPGGRHGRRRRLGHAVPRLRGHRLRGSLPGGHRPEELPQAGNLRRQGHHPVRPGKPERTRLPGRHRPRPRTGLPPDPGQRTRAPLPGRLVAAGPHHRLGTHLHARDPRLPRRHRRRNRAVAVVRRRPGRPADPDRRRGIRGREKLT